MNYLQLVISLILFISLPQPITTIMTTPPNMQANMLLLYSNTNSMPNTTFSNSFTHNYISIPTFAYGINDYKMKDRFGTQHFLSTLQSITGNSFTISVISISTTNVSKFSISYIAVNSTEISIGSLYKAYPNPTNISSGTGGRSFTDYANANFSSYTPVVQPLLTGFSITSTDFYQLFITTSYFSSVNYIITVQTTSNCLVHEVYFYVLVYYPAVLSGNSYYFYGGLNIFGNSTVNLASYDVYLSNYAETNFILALRGFYGPTSVATNNFGWSIANITNDNAKITIYKLYITELQYSFLQIGKYINNAATTDTTITSDTSYLGIIIGLIVGVMVLGVGILLVVRYCSRSTIYNTPKMDNFRQLPTLAL